MKILLSSMTFAPDHSGISLYATDFAVYAAEQGHEVTAVTGFSWYPKWKKRPEDKRKFFKTDVYHNIKVLRGYLYVPKKISTLTRIIQEISFLFFTMLNFLRAGKQDIIVLFTTPINLGLVGVLYQKLWGAKLIINVQDLQLDAAKSLGMVGKLSIVDIMNSIEKFTYKQADLVTSISDAMTDLIKQKDIPLEKIYLWPNWINVAETRNKGTKGNFRKKNCQYADKIIVGYAGNVGIKQGLHTLIDLCDNFKDHDEIIFLIIGNGGDLVNLKAMAKCKNLSNLDFIDFLSQEDYFDFLSDADIVFVSQKKDSGDVYFPSKLLGLMAKEKLIFVAADEDSELFKVFANNELAMHCEYGNADRMQFLLNDYLHDREKYNKHKANAFNYVQQYDRKAVLQRVFDKIEELRINTKQQELKMETEKQKSWVATEQELKVEAGQQITSANDPLYASKTSKSSVEQY